MFSSKCFSCLFERPCLFKGKTNLSVPDAFPFSSAKFFFSLRIAFWSSDVIDHQKWKSHLPSKKSPDPTKRHLLTLRWPPQGVCLRLWAWEKRDRALCPFTRGQQLNMRQPWRLTLCQGSVLSSSQSFIWQLVPESLCVSAFLPKHNWSSDIMGSWDTKQKRGREISGVFESDQRHSPLLHVNLHPCTLRKILCRGHWGCRVLVYTETRIVDCGFGWSPVAVGLFLFSILIPH